MIDLLIDLKIWQLFAYSLVSHFHYLYELLQVAFSLFFIFQFQWTIKAESIVGYLSAVHIRKNKKTGKSHLFSLFL